MASTTQKHRRQQIFDASRSRRPQAPTTRRASLKRSPRASSRIDTGARRAMIAGAAYYLAAGRGFAWGRELSDWLIAEAAVESLCGCGEAASLYGV